MSEIPDEIMEQARKLVALETFPDEETATVGIAKAILAAEQRGAERERERCAKLAESDVNLHVVPYLHMSSWKRDNAMQAIAADRIAAAIRRGDRMVISAPE